MLLSNERGAICFSGEPRALKNVHENIRNFLDNNFKNYDVFGYIPFCTSAPQLKQYFPEATIKMEMDQYIDDSKIPDRNRFPPHSGKQAYLQQINGWKQSNLMRKEREIAEGFEYDFVLRCRMDVRYTTPMPDFVPQKDRIYIPNFHHHTGINDRWCLGPPDLINNFMDIIDLYHENPSICTHAESFLLHCLKKQNTPIELIQLKFNRVRENGDECHWDSTDP